MRHIPLTKTPPSVELSQRDNGSSSHWNVGLHERSDLKGLRLKPPYQWIQNKVSTLKR